MATAFRDYPKYFELIDGRRYAKVSPQRTHGILQLWLARRIADAAGARGDVGTEWKFYLGGRPGAKNALQPDVSFVSYERLAALTPAQAEKPRFAPDLAVEIRSPGDRPGLLRRKTARYLAKGSVLVVIVDPAKRTVSAHGPDDVTSFSEGDVFVHPAVPWLGFDVTALFEAARLRRT